MIRASLITARSRLALVVALGLVAALGASLVLVYPHLVHAAGPQVTDCANYSGPGTLGDALAAASPGDTITFACDTPSGGLVMPAGSPAAYTVSQNLTLDASGHSVTLNGNNATRLFEVNSGVSFTLNNLILTSGSITGGQAGGAIENSGGTLTITDSTFTSNTADMGGAIAANGGTVTISNSIFSQNTSSNGGAIGLLGPTGSSATLTISNTTFANNSVTNTTSTATGGALSVDMDNSAVTITGSTFSGNFALAGEGQFSDGGAIYAYNGVSGTMNISDSTFSENAAMGDGSSGGALALVHETLTLSDSTISGNYSRGTDSKTNGDSAGLFLSAGSGGTPFGSATITGTTITGNHAIGVGGAQGGCILNEEPLTLANSTLTSNIAASNANTGFSIGGCILNTAPLTMTNVTLAGNLILGATTVGSDLETSASVTITNSIIADVSSFLAGGPTTGDCSYNSSGLLTDGGNNLESGTSCGFTSTGDLQNSDPKLAMLADYGGPTETMALQAGSPAIDAGNDSVCAATPISALDQRGTTRPTGTHCDIGAYEYVPLIASATALTVAPTAAHCGQSVTLTAKVTVTSGSTTPSGTVTFKNGTTSLGTGTLAGGTTTVTTKALTGGKYSLTAIYSGDFAYSSSTSSTLTLTVSACPTPTPTTPAGPTTGLDGLGPVAPPANAQASNGQQGAQTSTSKSHSGSHGSTKSTSQTTKRGASPTNYVDNGTTTPGFAIWPIVLFLLLVLVVGGLLGVSYLRRQQSHL